MRSGSIAYLVIAAIWMSLIPEPTLAAGCDAHFPFDGSLADASGNGNDGQMIVEDGAAGAPQFAEGKYGQALHIAGDAAMRALLDLHYEACPKLTFTAWFKLASVGAEGHQTILSTGARGGIPAIVVRESSLTLHGNANGLIQPDAIRDGNTWFFVAATFNYETRSYVLHWRNRTLEGNLSKTPYDAEDALWIGARNDDLGFIAQGLFIDDVRVYGRVLSNDEINDASRNAAAHATAPTATTVAMITDTSSPVPVPSANRTEINVPDNAIGTRPPLGGPLILTETPEGDPATWNSPEQAIADPNSQAVIHGRVANPSGEGVPGSSIAVYRAANGQHIANTLSGQDGRYSIAVFASEPVKVLFANSENFPHMSSAHGDHSESLEKARLIKISPGDQIEVNSVYPVLNCQIEGRVSHVSGLPLPGMKVGFYVGEFLNSRGQPDFLVSTTTDGNGQYAFDLSTVEDWSNFESIVGTQGCYGRCEAIRMRLQAFDPTGNYAAKTDYTYFHIQVAPTNGEDHCNDLDPEIVME